MKFVVTIRTVSGMLLLEDETYAENVTDVKCVARDLVDRLDWPSTVEVSAVDSENGKNAAVWRM